MFINKLINTEFSKCYIFCCRLLFSQSLYTLDLIQDFLENTEDLANDNGGPYGKSWIQGEDFFRIDGSVLVKTREDCCEKFNDVTNTKYSIFKHQIYYLILQY